MDLIWGLPEDRFDVLAVVSPRSDGEFLPDMEDMWLRGRRVEVIPMHRNPAPFSDVLAVYRLWRLLRRERPDVLHVHGSKGGLLGRLAGRMAGVPRIYHTPHVYPFQWARGLRRLILLAGERLLWRLSTSVVAVGQGQAAVALGMRLAVPERLVTIPNGVDADHFARLASPENRASVRRELGLAPDCLAVGMVARLAPQKGCGHFLRAARAVADRFPSAVFLLVGSGPLLPVLRAMAGDLGLGSRMMFLGHRQDADRLYAALDLFVLSSLWEGLPYAILEAQASGLAVVASRIPGCEELVESGKTGYLVEMHDETGIARKICELLADRDLRKRMGGYGQQRVATLFRRDTFISAHVALYGGKA
jgi:glycosyltransferase involved in cell wall biosynthesis